MTMLAGMSEEVDDEDIKEELMRCFLMLPLQTKQSISIESNAAKTRRNSQTVHCKV